MTSLAHRYPLATPTSPALQPAVSARASAHRRQNLTLDQPGNNSAVRTEFAGANAMRQASGANRGAATSHRPALTFAAVSSPEACATPALRLSLIDAR
jgi:hypothetical protein